MAPVGAKVPVLGSYRSAVANAVPTASRPPAIRTWPPMSSVAVGAIRALVIEPTELNPVAGAGAGVAVGDGVGVGSWLGLALWPAVAVAAVPGDFVGEVPPQPARTTAISRLARAKQVVPAVDLWRGERLPDRAKPPPFRELIFI